VGLSRCNGCGLIFYSATAGTREAYVSGEYVARHVDYVEEERAATHIAEERAAWLLSLAPPGNLLELGPGRGFFLDAVRRRGFDPVGVEPSPELAARARSDFGVEVKQGFLDEVDLSRDRFDSICMFHVLEHVEDPLALLGQLAALLREDGLLVIEVPNLASAMARRRADGWGAVQPGNLHISHFTPQSLRRVIERSGFEVLASDTLAPWRYIPTADRWRHRALLGYAYRAASLRTLRVTHESGFDHLRLVARPLR
jgi:SAM-dependent methyltransferase